MDKPKVKIYTDGACANNPGLGGWGAILMYEKSDGATIKKEISKGFKLTTNNRMELSAVVDSLSTLKKACEVELYSDSKYVVDAINNKWLDSWQAKGWKTGSKSPVKNIDLWKKLIPLLDFHSVRFIWVKGHNENEFNERCDKLAVEARLGGNLYTDDGYTP